MTGRIKHAFLGMGAVLLSVSVPNVANAECTLVNQIRAAVPHQFNTISGGPVSKSNRDTKSTLKVDGAKCTISRSGDGEYATHQCEWLISRNPAEAKSVFRQMVSETASCLRGKDSPSFHVNDRSETAVMDDGPKTFLNIRYYFDSGWYLLTFEYGIENR